MDFDLDDPLGDLLSDGSNDSFFESGIKNKSKNAKATDSKSKVANLFGIGSEKVAEKELAVKPSATPTVAPQPTPSSTSIFNAGSSKPPTTPKPAVKDSNEDGPTKKIDSAKSSRDYLDLDKADDLFADLGTDLKKPTGNLKKMNILDDLLNFGDSKSTPKKSSNETHNEPLTRTNIRSSPQTTRQTEPIKSNVVTDTPAGTNRYSPSLGRPRSITRANSGTPASDPLGFFSFSSSDQNEINASEAKATKEKPKKPVAVDWLGLNVGKEPAQEVRPERTISKEEKQDESGPPYAIPTPANAQNVVRNPELTLFEKPALPDMNQSVQLLNRVSNDSQAALQTLDQQQTQLNIAVQMRQQENVLLEMHSKQGVLLKQQEIQFNDLIRRQLNRQAILEENISRQQEQINAQINALLTQPVIGNSVVSRGLEQSENSEARGNTEIARNSQIEMKADIKRLELEKLRLEDLVQSIRGKHEQELDLLDASHKKQIVLLEENITNQENRLRMETKSQEEYYVKQIACLKNENEDLISKYDDRIAQMNSENENILKKLRSDYETEIENNKNDHRMMIENIRSSKLLEFSVVQENGSYLNTLKNASKNLEYASDNLQTLKVEMESNIERLLNEREVQLDAREKRSEEQKKMMEKTSEAAESERTRLIDLTKNLELKLSSLEQSSVEEQWALRQQRSNIEVERVALEREKQFYREKQAAEEKRIQDLKQQQLLEYSRFMDQIESERSNLLTERVKLETLERIQPTSSRITVDRNEVEAAIKVAQDAARLADVEREKLLESQRQLETRKRELLDKENSIESKQRDLESSINEASVQRRQAEYAARSYKALEQKMLSKIQEVHRSFNELAEREGKLSKEKMEISRDRLQLNNLRKKLFQNRCSLCKIDDRTKEITDLLTKSNDEVLNVTDPTAIDSFLNATKRTTMMNDIDDVLNIDNILNTDSIIANIIPSSIGVNFTSHDLDLDFQENI